MGHDIITSLTIQKSDGSVKYAAPKGRLALSEGSLVTIEDVEGALMISSGVDPDAPPPAGVYDQTYKDIIGQAGSFSDWTPYAARLGGAGPADGSLTMTGDACLHVGSMPEPDGDTGMYGSPVVQLEPLTLRDGCPPCSNCKDFLKKEGSSDNEGLFDMISLIDEFMMARAAEITAEESGLLDRLATLQALWNRVTHNRGCRCEAITTGRKTAATFKYANLTDQEQQVHVTIGFKDTQPESRGLYVDSATEGFDKSLVVWRDNRDDDFYAPDGGPQVIVDVMRLPSGGRLTTHAAMWQPKGVKDGSAPTVVFTFKGDFELVREVRTNNMSIMPPWIDLKTGAKP